MRLKKFNLSPQEKSFDITFLVIVLILVVFGLVILYDVSIIQAYRDFGDYYYYIKQQLIWTFIGILALAFFAVYPYQKLKKISTIFLIFAVGLLGAVFIPGLGTESGGAQRWLDISFLRVQPSEIFKLAAIMWLANSFEKGGRFKPLLILLGLATILMGLLQKDLGSTIVLAFTAVLIYIISGGSVLRITLAAPVLIAGLVGLILTSEYRRRRILAFLDPFSDPQGFTYHISQVLIALGSGGFFGLGLGQSRQKFEYIPEVTTDSIFAIIGEQLGFLGGFAVLGLFAFLIIRGFKIAQNCSDNFGKILAAGLTSWIGIQAIINLSAMVALLPLTGVPLPLISYGGSALITNLVAVGILLNISRKNS